MEADPNAPDPSSAGEPSRQVATSLGNAEVWLVDQSNSAGQTYGGAIHIFKASQVLGNRLVDDVAEVIDLAGATASRCVASTAAAPVRPHMLFFNSTHTHAVLSFVASGHVVVFDAATREPVSCLRTAVGAGGARQAHAAIPSPDDTYILVANQNGKLLERITADYATNTFTLESAATLDLALCTTPNGAACQLAGVRPDNAPICPLVASDARHAFVTLRGGGLFVVDAKATPMQIVAEYDAATIHGNGCGGTEAGGHMYVNSGGGTAANLHEFDVYSFPLTGYSASNPPNRPERALVFSDDTEPRDSHGTAAIFGKLWVFDRGLNVAEVFDAASGAHLGQVDMVGASSQDPTPDLADVLTAGNRMFVSLRGPNPLTGDPHVATGGTPGLGVMEIQANGRAGTLRSVIPITNLDAGGVERADPHGIRVRGY
jgi:hypothetical protein